MTDAIEIGTGGTIRQPGRNATLEELEAAFREFEASDAPLMLKESVLADLADRIRRLGETPADLPPAGEGVFFKGAPVETVVASGFEGEMMDQDGTFRRVKGS